MGDVLVVLAEDEARRGGCRRRSARPRRLPSHRSPPARARRARRQASVRARAARYRLAMRAPVDRSCAPHAAPGQRRRPGSRLPQRPSIGLGRQAVRAGPDDRARARWSPIGAVDPAHRTARHADRASCRRSGRDGGPAFSTSTSTIAADRRAIEGLALRFEQRLQRGEALRLHRLGHRVGAARRPACPGAGCT